MALKNKNFFLALLVFILPIIIVAMIIKRQ